MLRAIYDIWKFHRDSVEEWFDIIGGADFRHDADVGDKQADWELALSGEGRRPVIYQLTSLDILVLFVSLVVGGVVGAWGTHKLIDKFWSGSGKHDR